MNDSALFEPLTLNTRHLCDVSIDLDPHSPGLTTKGPFAIRSVFNVAGGSFEGERLRGTLAGAGADFPLTARNDTNTVALDVRTVWRAENGDLIYVYYYGRLVTPPDLAKVLFDPRENHKVDPGDYYWRVSPVFETDSKELAWLNNIVSIGVGRYTEAGLAYRLYEVL
jgi:hypothetical protein